jgi:hypothetical protein
MENGWKMGDGKCKPHAPPPGWCSSGILFFVAHTFMSTKIKSPLRLESSNCQERIIVR